MWPCDKRESIVHSSIAVANELLFHAEKSGDTLTPMQLIKLVYLAHGWMLGVYGRPMLEESVEAWRYGPVLRNLYQRVKEFRDLPVVGPIKRSPFGGEVEEEFSAEESHIIAEVFRIYKDWSGIELSSLTHQQGSPWDITWRGTGENAEISNDLIEYHYKSIYAERMANG